MIPTASRRVWHKAPDGPIAISASTLGAGPRLASDATRNLIPDIEEDERAKSGIAAGKRYRAVSPKYDPNFASCGMPTATILVFGISPGWSSARSTTATSDISELAIPWR